MDTNNLIDKALHAAEQNMTDVLTLWANGRTSDLVFGEALKDMKNDSLKLVKSARKVLAEESSLRSATPPVPAAPVGEDDGVVPASALYWYNASLKAEKLEDREFCAREAYKHVVGQLYALARTTPAPAVTEAELPRQALIAGIPRLPEQCRQEFVVRLENGSHTRLWWLENYTLDNHGDEVQETGWHTCLPEEGYANFFRKWKGRPVTHYLSEVPLPTAPTPPTCPATCQDRASCKKGGVQGE